MREPQLSFVNQPIAAVVVVFMSFPFFFVFLLLFPPVQEMKFLSGPFFFFFLLSA